MTIDLIAKATGKDRAGVRRLIAQLRGIGMKIVPEKPYTLDELLMSPRREESGPFRPPVEWMEV